MLRIHATIAAVLALAAAACHDKSAPKPEPAAAAAAAPPASQPGRGDADDTGLSPNARLALQRVDGQSGADKEIESTQATVRQLMTKDDAWVFLGRAWIRKARESNDPGFYLNADACASVVLERNPDYALALDLRGLVLLNGHKFAEAQELAARILAQRPDDAMAWGTSSDALLEMGRYPEAIAATQQMISLKPNLPSYSRVSHIQWLHGDLKHAKDTVRAAIDSGRAAKREPEPGAWVIVQAAMIFWHEGDYEGAEAGFDKALERLPDFAPANVGKGRVAMARGDYRRAAELFERAFKASPLVETSWLLGDARDAAGDAKGATEAYGYVDRDGHRTDPRTLSLFLSTKSRDPGEALRLAREEYETRKDVVTEDALAWALFRNGKLDDAKASILRARRLGTPDARLVFHEGAIRLASGETKETKKGLELLAQAKKMNRAFDLSGSKELEALLSSEAKKNALASR